MSQAFGPDYANSYDLVYADKDYEAECDLIEHIFHVHGDGAIVSVLDLGCGTGNHSLPVSRRGYEVVGVDRSESMLGHARQKQRLVDGNSKLNFQQGDIRSLDLGRRFDAALMMFAVLSYQLDNADVLCALKTARRHLRSAGLLIFDAWYGPAVLHQRPSQRVRVLPTPGGEIIRVASGQTDVRRHVCTVDVQMWRLAEGSSSARTRETHLMRYFFPLELNLFLECSEFKPIRLGAFHDFDKDPDETTWNCLGVAQAV